MVSAGSVLDLLKQTAREVGDDNCTTWSAAIAYYTLFSLPPLLVVLIGIAGAVWGADAVQEALTGQVGDLVGERGAEEIQTMIQNASDFGSGSVLGTVIGLAALVFGATGAFAQLQAALNRAWEVGPDPDEGGLMSFLTKRVLSFGMVLTLAFLLLASLAVSAALSAFGDAISGSLGGASGFLLGVLNFAVSLVIIAVLFAAIFKVLPDAEISWKDVAVGGLATALLFVIGKTLIGLYLGHSSVGDAFGAAGSLVVILVWIYYTALLLLVGAEFTQVWAKHYGDTIRPEEGAVRVIREKKTVHPGREEATGAEGADEDEQAGGDAGRAEVRHPYAEPREPHRRSGINE
ncbi:MAG: YihY/virulence factor BrkB family protein [Rhodothermales bacterium]|nr:YihY/virulence factor BrkB family protein [Rhodothermales bacterium]